MINRKNNILAAALLSACAFFTVVYVSCKKVTDGTMCKNIVCRNGGHCDRQTSKCSCPVGYEDTVCGTRTVAKYISNWGVKQTITFSDSDGFAGTSSNFITSLNTTATPTTFYFSNFNNNPYYNTVVCTLDSPNSYRFWIDTMSTFQMIYYSYKIIWGYGEMNATRDTINAHFVARHLSFTHNWMVDSVDLVMAKHDY